MRPLWPIERAALEAATQDDAAIEDSLTRQIQAASVVNFENSGAGFFSTIAVTGEVPALPESSPLKGGAVGNVDGIEHGMGFILFVENGRLSLLEGYCHGDASTTGVDFQTVEFDLKPWSTAAT
jgi:hypothetical protein